MDLPDVNVLIGAHRAEVPAHRELRGWLESAMNGDSAYGMSELVVSAFLRIVTNVRVFRAPTPMAQALLVARTVTERPNCVLVRPGPRHFSVFLDLCAEPGVRGNLVPNAYFAALAIESGCRWITRDRDFARFPGLSWHDPVAVSG